MTGYAVAHAERDVSLGHRLMRDIAVAGRAFDVRANVRRVVEFHMRRLRVSVYPLPREIDALFRHRRDLLNARLVGRNRRVTDQAGIDARQACPRALRDALMAILETRQPFLDVDAVRELDRLYRRRF